KLCTSCWPFRKLKQLLTRADESGRFFYLCHRRAASQPVQANGIQPSAMRFDYPPTVIVRHSHENPRKCSVLPLRSREDIVFLARPVKERPPLVGYVRLAAEGPELSCNDEVSGLLLLDGSWRWAGKMAAGFADVPPRSLRGWRTAYPRVSKHGTDPDN